MHTHTKVYVAPVYDHSKNIHLKLIITVDTTISAVMLQSTSIQVYFHYLFVVTTVYIEAFPI